MCDSTQLVQVSNASLYAIVTLYSFTSSGDPYLSNQSKILIEAKPGIEIVL